MKLTFEERTLLLEIEGNDVESIIKKLKENLRKQDEENSVEKEMLIETTNSLIEKLQTQPINIKKEKELALFQVE